MPTAWIPMAARSSAPVGTNFNGLLYQSAETVTLNRVDSRISCVVIQDGNRGGCHGASCCGAG